jgi:hypothetical protein
MCRDSATKRPAELRPVDGEFRSSPRQRRAVCREAGHPQMFLNVSSTPGRRVTRCLCGEKEVGRGKE